MVLHSSFALFSQKKQVFITSDVTNFWIAFDKIQATSDSNLQYTYLQDLYINKASPGLLSLMEVRRYTNKEFIDAIHNYPEFWKSIRKNTSDCNKLIPSIETDLNKLKKLYPWLKPAPVYFSIGAFRTNGTVHNGKVLIGCELALADSSTIIGELPEWRQPFYKEYEPKKNIALLCTHEYIHTQQKELVENLLSMCLYEGIAEFVSCKATGKKSNNPAIEYGKANEQKVRDQFIKDIFLPQNTYNWMWGQNRNELKIRDLGYYIGYEISERYYNLSKNKAKAIKELIELAYTNEKEVERIVDITNFLPLTLTKLNEEYEKQRPSVSSVMPFENGSQSVKPGITKITITFSEALNGFNSGIDFGPMGESACPKVSPERVWSTDKKSWTFEADLKPGKTYQILIPNTFRKENGINLKPYLIEFKTSE